MGLTAETEQILLYTRVADPSRLTKWYEWLWKERASRLPGKSGPGPGMIYHWAFANMQLLGSQQVINKMQQTWGYHELSSAISSLKLNKIQGSRQSLWICINLSGFISLFSVWWNAKRYPFLHYWLHRSHADTTYRSQLMCSIVRNHSNFSAIIVTDFLLLPAIWWLSQTCVDGRKTLTIALLTTISAHHFNHNKHLLPLWLLLQRITSKQSKNKRKPPSSSSLALDY